MRYAEFCTGIGGFSLGIKKAFPTANLVYANEINEACERTFKSNFKKTFDSKDIFDIDTSMLPDFDLMCSGFPCQPFSQAGKGLGFDDKRGTVFFKLLEIIEVKKPKILFFENVPNLKSHRKGETFKIIKQQLEISGYSIFSEIIDSADFGVPQSRPRFYIIGLRNDFINEKSFSFTKSLGKRKTLRSILNSGDYSIPISKKWEEYIDLYTNVKTPNEISFELPKTRKKLERISKNCDLNDCIFQIRSSGIRAYSLDDTFPTFAVSNSGGGAMIPVLSKEKRHLNLMEMKRIMGFPDDFAFPISRTDSIKQLANAVCPPVIESILNDIKKIM